MLNETQRKQLLRIARESIEAVLDGCTPQVEERDVDDVLKRSAGAFVTLTKHEELRGCIGSIQAVAPLYRAVSMSAVNAAFRDPRFFPLDKREYAEIDIEISVMGPIERVISIDEIVVGRDGLIISRGQHAGLLLPQVATEYGWTREEFLEHTCRKAGLPPQAWREAGTTIEKFSAEVFGEKDT